MAATTCPDLTALQLYLKSQEAAERALSAACSSSSEAVGGGERLQLSVHIGNTCEDAAREGYVNWTMFVNGDGSFDVSDHIKQIGRASCRERV